MPDIALASSEAEAHAVEAIESHHAELVGGLHTRVSRLVQAAQDSPSDLNDARTDLVDWCDEEIVPHAKAEEVQLYPAAQELAEGRLLVEAMLGEHQTLVGLVERVRRAGGAAEAVAAAGALDVLFEAHAGKENEQLVPLLAATPGVSVADALSGMQQALASAKAHAQPGAGDAHADHACTCGEHDGPGYPELDARAIPHAIRHATVFGALEAVPPGGGLVLLAPHDPLPLLAQIEQRFPQVFSVDYLEKGPEVWRLLFSRGE